MKILFISLEPFPYSGACVSLLNKVLTEGQLSKKFSEVHVLTVKTAFDECDYECIDGVRIHRCFPLLHMSKKEALQMMRTKPLYAIWRMLLKGLYKFNIFSLGQPTLLYRDSVLACYKMLKKLRTENFDVIIPICGLYETAAAALKFIKKYNSKMVLYLMDPCATNARFAGKLEQKAVQFEKEIFESASAIITTPIGYAEAVHMYPENIKKKLYVVAYPNISSKENEMNVVAGIKYRCVFAGKIYAHSRNPRYTLRLFNLLKNPELELHFIGITESDLRAFIPGNKLEKNVICHGVVPLDEARNEIARADFLINIGNIMTNQVPSKVFEYMSACKPIISVCANENCTAIPYLRKYPRALWVVEGVGTEKEHAEQIEKFIAENTGCTVDREVVLERFKDCTPEYCSKQIFDILTAV